MHSSFFVLPSCCCAHEIRISFLFMYRLYKKGRALNIEFPKLLDRKFRSFGVILCCLRGRRLPARTRFSTLASFSGRKRDHFPHRYGIVVSFLSSLLCQRPQSKPCGEILFCKKDHISPQESEFTRISVCEPAVRARGCPSYGRMYSGYSRRPRPTSCRSARGA